MKRRLCVAACLAAFQACAANGADAPAPAPAPARAGAQDSLRACPGFRDLGSARMTLDEMRGPIEAAVNTIDDGQVEPPSPVLATGKLTWLGVSFALPEDPGAIRVLGYFHVEGAADCAIPLLATHILSMPADAEHPAAEKTRIYYRMPDLGLVAGRFHMYHHASLRIAVYGKDADGGLGKLYFGRRLDLVVSSRYGAACVALSFAAAFYLMAAGAVAAVARREIGEAGRGWRAAWLRLMPWNILSDSGQTALSQLQMLLFTLIIATLLFYQWLRTGLLQELSTDLLYLIGISTVGAAGSQVTAAFKKGLERKVYDYVQQLGWFTAPALRPRRVAAAELLMTDRRFDANKFQMLVFTFVIAAYVIEAGASELDTLHISSTMLTLMGISQGAYVGGHAASDTLATLQHQLLGMRSLQERYLKTADAGIQAELERRFAQAAARAAAMFGAMFGREVPADMLAMPAGAIEGEAAAEGASA